MRGSRVRWLPHPLNPADIMTKSDISKGNAALSRMSKTGRFRILDESEEMKARLTKSKPNRSKLASEIELDKIDSTSSSKSSVSSSLLGYPSMFQ